jgi:hypothetical protein
MALTQIQLARALSVGHAIHAFGPLVFGNAVDAID